MDLQLGLVVFSAAAAGLSFIFSAICYSRLTRSKKLVDALIAQVGELEHELREVNELNDAANLRAIDHARRIAWLETRVRKPEKHESQGLSEEAVSPKKSNQENMTERRHRVLTLASRGQDAGSIAAALGMFIGEVDLIMRLGRSSGRFA